MFEFMLIPAKENRSLDDGLHMTCKDLFIIKRQCLGAKLRAETAVPLLRETLY